MSGMISFADALEQPEYLIALNAVTLSKRSHDCLKKDDILYVIELVQRSENEMLGTWNFGRQSLNELREFLGNIGLNFGTEITDIPEKDDIRRQQIAEARLKFSGSPEKHIYRAKKTDADTSLKSAAQEVLCQIGWDSEQLEKIRGSEAVRQALIDMSDADEALIKATRVLTEAGLDPKAARETIKKNRAATRLAIEVFRK